MTEQLLGRSINRLEDERFVRGRGRYIADLSAPGALHGVVVRSGHAHARIVALHPEAALQMPGVAAVLTGLDLAADNIGPLPCAVTNIPMAKPLIVPPYHALARDVVRFVGEPVAFVVAERDAIARDAAEAIVVDYEPLQPVISMAEAVLSGSSSIWPLPTTSRLNSSAAKSVRLRRRSAPPPMSWNASSSTTVWWPRHWKRGGRSAHSMHRSAVCT
jgi:aerobic carbon-monoxide dehydrogenase large subunit